MSLEHRIARLEELIQLETEQSSSASEKHRRVQEVLEKKWTHFRQVRDEHEDIDVLATEPGALEMLRELSALSMLEKHHSRGFPLDPYGVERLRRRGFDVEELV